MRIRTSSTLAALMAMMQLSSCQEKNYRLDVEAKDTDGNPVSSVKVITGKLVAANGGLPTLANAITVESDAANVEGKIRLEYKSLPEPDGTLSVYGNGYYTSCYSFDWKSPDGQVGMTRSAEIKAVLKPIKNPIPMSAHTFGNTRIIMPMIGVDYGYDLEVCEFLPPHGKGKHEDIVFHVSGSNDGKGKGKIQMTIRGNGNQTGFAGFITKNRKIGSVFISDYLAPQDNYANSLSFIFNSADMMAAMNQPTSQNYYFRVRCQLNPDGSIKSCHYGKLYGPFSFWNIPVEQGGVASFGMQTSYFNPTPNDRNVEFDPKRNLISEGNVHRP